MKTKHSSKAERYAEEIGKRFISDRISHAYSFGDGHINDTFCLVTDKESYICQRIRGKIDTGILEHNYLLYSELFEKADLLYPRWLKTSENSFFYNDANIIFQHCFSDVDGIIVSKMKEIYLSNDIYPY